MDFPRRALLEEPDDVESYVARRSRGFTPADNTDQLVVRPARAAQAPEPTTTDDSPRPRRALFAERLTPDADEEKSTATEAGIGRRAIDPLPQTVQAYAPRREDSIPVRSQPAPPSAPPTSLPLSAPPASPPTSSPRPSPLRESPPPLASAPLASPPPSPPRRCPATSTRQSARPPTITPITSCPTGLRR